jgi:hypothetical protein
LLAVCGSTHSQSYFEIAITAIVVPIIALVVVIVLGPSAPPRRDNQKDNPR